MQLTTAYCLFNSRINNVLFSLQYNSYGKADFAVRYYCGKKNLSIIYVFSFGSEIIAIFRLRKRFCTRRALGLRRETNKPIYIQMDLQLCLCRLSQRRCLSPYKTLVAVSVRQQLGAKPLAIVPCSNSNPLKGCSVQCDIILT